MLGREHELDLEREARARRLAGAVTRTDPATSQVKRRRRIGVVQRRLAGVLR
jgi:hypothetical protein